MTAPSPTPGCALVRITILAEVPLASSAQSIQNRISLVEGPGFEIKSSRIFYEGRFKGETPL